MTYGSHALLYEVSGPVVVFMWVGEARLVITITDLVSWMGKLLMSIGADVGEWWTTMAALLG